MKALRSFQKTMLLFAMLGFIASCGSDDNRTGGDVGVNNPATPVVNPVLAGSGLLPTLEGQPVLTQINALIQQTPCLGVNPQRQLISVDNLGNPIPFQNLNFANYQTLAVGKNPYGDIVVLTVYGPQTQTLTVSTCARDYVGPVQRVTGQNLITNVSPGCTVNEITSGTIFLNGFEPVLVQPINMSGVGYVPVPGLCQ